MHLQPTQLKCERKRWAARLLMAFAVLFTPLRVDAQAPDFSDWTLRIAGQIVTVNPDGTFLIPNVQAPDLFGPGGPGTVPDFLSDDYYRIIGTSTKNGFTLYLYTEYFRIRQGSVYYPTNWTITAVPPPMPDSIRALPSKPAMTEIGETAQMTVIATLADGTTIDVTSGDQWTTYRTSNKNIVGVDGDGLLTANGRGTAYITAINDSATAVAQVDVVPGGQLTTVHGLVQTPEGLPVPGVQINLIGPAGTTVTEEDGSFTIPGVSAEIRIAAILARGPFGGEVVFGRSGAITPVPSGVTDAGIIIVRSCEELGIDCVDTDNDCLPDSVEVAIRLDPLNPDTGLQGLPDGEKDTDGDSISNCIEVLFGTNPGSADSDGDGISDPDEIYRHGTDPRLADTDGDSLSDGNELLWGTDLLNPDSDRDGWNDGGEVLSRSNPLNAEDNPKQQLASEDVSYLNGLLAPLERSILQTIGSSVVSYENEAPAPEPATEYIVASSSVSYLNGSTENYQDIIPRYEPMILAAAPVSYVNGVLDYRPETLPHTAFSLAVSYLNGLPAAAGEDSFVASTVVSYENEAEPPPPPVKKLTTTLVQ